MLFRKTRKILPFATIVPKFIGEGYLCRKSSIMVVFTKYRVVRISSGSISRLHICDWSIFSGLFVINIIFCPSACLMPVSIILFTGS